MGAIALAMAGLTTPASAATALTVTKVSPNSDKLAGGAVISITGSGFTA